MALPIEEAKAKADQVRSDLRALEIIYIDPFDETEREVTCEHCHLNDVCDLAFDLYNTDGDCLAEK